MEPQFWHDRWHAGQIAFHQNSVHRLLPRFWPLLNVDKRAEVFVPLCGKSLDLLWLTQRGHTVSGVELSELAIESFLAENGVLAQRCSALQDFDVYSAPGLRLWRGDFFALSPQTLGAPAAIYDRAALISWRPELRRGYAEHMAQLAPAGTQTLLITMEYPAGQANGPPFSVSDAEVHELYAAHYEIRLLDRIDILDDEPRFRQRGVTSLHEACYLMTRGEG